jgi:signal transduction histidine kinase
MARNLHLRLVLTHLGLLLAGLLLLGLAFAAILTNRVAAAHQSDLRYETSSLAMQLDRALARNARKAAIQRLIRRDSELMGKRIILLDPRGRVRYDSTRWTPFSRGSWQLVDLAALRRGMASPMDSSDRFGWQVPLSLHGRVAGAVTLVITSSKAMPPWQQVLPALLAVFGLLLLTWLVIGAYLVRSLVRPLRQVSDALALVRGGQYNRPVLEEGWSEARELARRYNEMVAEVAHSHQLLRDFVANAAHELKTPVALVTGFARSLGDGTAERGDAVREAVGYIQTESEHLAQVVEQLFALASLDADADALVLSLCQPAVLLRRVVERFTPRAVEEGELLSCQCTDNVPNCLWDTQRAMSALANLVSNALDYTRTGDTIVARLCVPGNEIAFELQDSGCGIAADELSHIFDRFYRGGRSTRSQGHAGLGLAMVHEVARRHSGAITVESRFGEGSCFTLSLPVDQGGREQPRLEGMLPESELTA